VVIVGAGPAGAALAVLLARAHVPVALVEASTTFSRQFRGEALMPSGVAVLERLGLWPLAASIPQRPLGAWSFYVNGRLLFEQDEPMGSAHPCTLVDQEAFLPALVEIARQAPTCQWYPGQSVTGLCRAEGVLEPGQTPANSRITGVTLGDGTTLPADLVVGCDGRASRLRPWADLPLQALPSPLDVLWFRLADSDASAALGEWVGERFATLVGDGGSFALFRSAAGPLQLGWAIPAPSQDESMPSSPLPWPERWARASPRELADLLRRLPLSAITGPVRLPVRVGRCARWHRPGLLLLGDAAHPLSPLRAQGMAMALRDAEVAAELLLPALRATPTEPLAIDAAVARIAERRQPEISVIQRLQHQETQRADLLRRHAGLRQVLALSAPWSGPLLAHHWLGQQRILRDGLP
jgi:hypothetical protein